MVNVPTKDARSEETRFQDWLRRVDSAIQAKCGLGMLDLDDYSYRDAFEDGRSPGSVARSAIKAAGG